MEMTTKLTAREQFLRDVLCIALEGGIGYWSRASKILRDGYRSDSKVMEPGFGDWTYLGYTLHDEEGKKHVVTVETVARGLKLLTQDTKISLRSDLRKAIMLANIQNDGGEIDADAADCIVQAGIFGDVVYG